METIGGLISKMTFDPLAIVAAIIAFFATFGTFIAQKNFVLKKERYDKLIAPLFFTLEPYLYRESEDYIIDKAVHIISQNISLADGKLLALLYECKENPSQKSFIRLCSYVDEEYDNSCRSLRLKRRPYSYRIARHQYLHKWILIKNMIKYWFFYVGIIFIAIIAFMASFSILGKVLGLDDAAKQLAVYTASYLVMFAVLKYFNKNF